MKNELMEILGNNLRGFVREGWGRLATFLAAGLLTLASVPAGGHPGHGLAEDGAAHVVTSPYHLTMLAGGALMLGLGLVMGARLVRSARARRFMQIGAGCALLAAAALGLR